MNVNAKIQEFIEGRIRESEALADFFANGFAFYYETAPENAPTPYLRYMIQPPVPQGRNLEGLKFISYDCAVDINIVGNSLEQVRFLSQAVTEAFDGFATFDNYEHIEDCESDTPDEQIFYDSETRQTIYETAQEITFYFLK